MYAKFIYTKIRLNPTAKEDSDQKRCRPTNDMAADAGDGGCVGSGAGVFSGSSGQHSTRRSSFTFALQALGSTDSDHKISPQSHWPFQTTVPTTASVSFFLTSKDESLLVHVTLHGAVGGLSQPQAAPAVACIARHCCPWKLCACHSKMPHVDDPSLGFSGRSGSGTKLSVQRVHETSLGLRAGGT